MLLLGGAATQIFYDSDIVGIRDTPYHDGDVSQRDSKHNLML